MEKLNYRPEIDILRAISVIGVIIFHIDKDWLPGGFVGVDVFFTISGYLITTLIQKELHLGSFSFKEFYTRRIQRIFPALFFTLFFSVLGCYFFLPPSESIFFFDSLPPSVLFLSNFYFQFFEGSYFHSLVESPLLHTWSLAIEEQYYLIFPLVLYLFRKKEKVVFHLLWISSLLACIFSAYCFNKGFSEWVFYFTPIRAFGIMMGSFTAMCVHKYNLSIKNYRSIFIGIIAASFWFINFKNFYNLTLVPLVFASCLYLIPTKSCDKTFLDKPLLWIGKRSYSLYLIHWPVFALLNYYSFSNTELLLILPFIILISHFSYEKVENKFRYRTTSFISSVRKVYVLPTIFFLIIAVISSETEGMKFRFKENLYDLYSTGPSDAYFFGTPAYGQFLTYHGESSPHFVLYGDSHAGHFQSFVRQIGNKLKLNISILASGNCPAGVQGDLKYTSQDELNICNKMFSILLNNLEQYDGIILGGYYADKENLKGFKEGYIKFIKSLNGKSVFLLSQVPEVENIKSFPLRALASRYNFTFKDDFVLNYRYEKGNEFIKSISQFENIKYIDLVPYFFNGEKPILYNENHSFIYKDRNHLNNAGSIFIGKKFVESEQLNKFKEQ